MPETRPRGAADRTIEREVLIEAPAEVVWRTITEPDQIAQWFADRIELDLRPNGAGTFVFDASAATDRVHTAALVVVTVDPPRLFSFRWGHAEGETPTAANSALVEFTLLAESSDRTRLRVVETGHEATAWSEDEKARYVDDHRQGWARHLGRLEDLFASQAR